MTEEHQFLVAITLGSAIIGAMGGLAGSLFVPWITHNIETKRLKRGIKPDLIETIYTLYNYNIGILMMSNVNAHKGKGVNLAWEDSKKPNLSVEEKNEILSQYKEIKELLLRDEESAEKDFYKTVELEAKILRILTEVRIYYGNSKYEIIYKVIRPILDDFNKSVLVMDFNSMSPDEYRNNYDEMIELVRSKQKILYNDSHRIISKIEETI